MSEWYEILIPIASLITACVAAITVYYLREQMKTTEKAYNSSKRIAQINAFLQIENNISYNEAMKKVRAAISTNKPVLKKDGGIIDYKDFSTYLDVLNRLPYFFNVGIIPEEDIIAAFGPNCTEIENNPHVVKYIKTVQKDQGDNILSEIHKMAEKFRELP